MSGPVTERGLLRVVLLSLLAAAGLFLVWRFLAAVATLSLVLVLGVLLAVALSGPVEALRRRKVPRAVSAGGILLAVAGVLALGGYLLIPVLEREISALIAAGPDAFSSLQQSYGQISGRLGLGSQGLPSPNLGELGQQALGGALGVFGTAASFVAGVVVMLFVAFYLSSNPEPVTNWVERLFPAGNRDRVREVLSESRVKLLRWLVGRLASMAVVGVLSVGVLYLIGIPGALSLGLFAGLVSFVPYIGPFISVVPPALLALAGDPVNALWVLAAYLAIQQVESYLITPLIMEEAVSLHPAAVIASVAVFGGAFGVLGTLLALPIIVVAGVLVEELWFRRTDEKA